MNKKYTMFIMQTPTLHTGLALSLAKTDEKAE